MENQDVIIGRKPEKKLLDSVFNSKAAEFIAIYGRRRVGKTYLIRQFFAKKKCIMLQAVGILNGDIREQLQNFTDSVSEAFYDNIEIKPPASWGEAFKMLTRKIQQIDSKNKIILFLDELPWMATPRSGLLESLDYYWNKYWSDMPNVKLIICGSSASWILRKIIYNKGGLHNRITNKINLKPFNLSETREYLISKSCTFSQRQIAEIYMCMGGVPYYLKNISNDLSATQNINNMCFRSDGLLFDEFNKLFASLFNDAESYTELIRIIAQKRYGIRRSDLEKEVKLLSKGGGLTDRLRDLEEAGFIISFLPIQKQERGLYYKVTDEYALFYLKWIEPEKKSFLKAEPESDYWKYKFHTPAWYSWAGLAFELLCYKHISNIRKHLDIAGDARVGTWSEQSKNNSQGAQIDLLFDRNDDALTICEIKYTTEPFVINKDYSKNILQKKVAFIASTKTKKQIIIALISAEGIKENSYSKDLISRVMTLDDFFGK
jgi:AAA+ ATPase superfamily predicted ATPase